MHYAVNKAAKNEDGPSVLMGVKGLTYFSLMSLWTASVSLKLTV